MPSLRDLKSLAARRVIRLLPQRVQLATLYRQINGVAPDLRTPQLLSERILHRIFFDRDPQLHTFCDKIAAKQWIAGRIGPDRTPRTLAVADSLAALRAQSLPDRWMLKASHGSGWYQLVESTAETLNTTVIEHTQKWLCTDYADSFQEWGYRNLPRRLLAEELLSCAGRQCTEISAFCFRGQVRGIRVYRPGYARSILLAGQQDRPRTKECFLTEAFQPLPIVRPQHDHCPELGTADPHLLEPFLELARELSSTTPFLRVDGYISEGGVLVGELTPYPGAGIWLRMPRPWDAWFGAFWD